MLDQKHKGTKGTIIIEFFRTEQFERPNKPNKIHTKTYETHFIEDANKKSSFADSIRIKQGGTFSLAKNNDKHRNDGGKHGDNGNKFFNRKRDDKFNDKRSYKDHHMGRTLNMSQNRSRDPRRPLPGGTVTENGMIIDYKVNYDKLVDSIIIHYADWSYL